MLIVLITNQIANGSIYLNVAAFMPMYCKHKYGDHISPIMVSFIIAGFEVTSIISSKIHAVTIHRMGRKNAIIIAYVTLAIATGCLGLLDYVP